MSGLDSITGRHIRGLEHLKQSIRDILTTPVGSRVMRRTYGSRLFELIDNPTNRRTVAAAYTATAEALRLWEPRFELQKVELTNVTVGRLYLTVYGLYKYENTISPIDLTIEVTK